MSVEPLHEQPIAYASLVDRIAANRATAAIFILLIITICFARLARKIREF